MTSEFEPLPSNLAAAHALILAERNARVMAEANAAVAKAEAANAQADLSSSEALIAHLKLEIEKLQREIYGTRSERKARLLEQMELQLEDLEAAATEDELAAENAAARTQTVQSFQRKRLSRKPFPDHLPRERVVCRAGQLSLLRVGEAVEAGRGHYRDAGGDPAAIAVTPCAQSACEARPNGAGPRAAICIGHRMKAPMEASSYSRRDVDHVDAYQRIGALNRPLLRHCVKPQLGKQVRGISRRSMRRDTRKRARIRVCRLPQESGQHFRKVGCMLPAPAGYFKNQSLRRQYAPQHFKDRLAVASGMI